MIDSTAVPSLPLSRTVRERLNLPDEYYDAQGFLKIPARRDARKLALLYGELYGKEAPRASDLYGAACPFPMKTSGGAGKLPAKHWRRKIQPELPLPPD